MPAGLDGPFPFVVRDCALAAIATAIRVQNLRELRDQLRAIHPGAIYYHFWGRLLRPRFDHPGYLNDFAEWAANGLRDARLAERLGAIDPTDFADPEALRQELVDVIEARLDESETVPWARSEDQFAFVRSQIVVFDTGRRVGAPEEFVAALPELSLGSVFYHFIDARRRTEGGMDDFRAWLLQFDEAHRELVDRLAALDPYFVSLRELREALAELFAGYFRAGARRAGGWE